MQAVRSGHNMNDSSFERLGRALLDKPTAGIISPACRAVNSFFGNFRSGGRPAEMGLSAGRAG